VTGCLYIHDNGQLTNVDGMPGLTSLGDCLEIHDNATLASLDGLSGLTTVASDLSIHHNDCLDQTEAEAFAAGLTVGGSVVVVDNGSAHPCN